MTARRVTDGSALPAGTATIRGVGSRPPGPYEPVVVADRGAYRGVALDGPFRRRGVRVGGPLRFRTTYRVATIERLLAVKGPEWLKDEIDRSDDPDYVARAIDAWFGRRTPLAGRKVLDFGCGCGATAVILARRGARVTGVDRDGPSLAAARLRAADAGVDAAFAVAGEGATLPFADGSFDLVLAYQVLEHLPPLARPAHVRTLWRLVRPGGRLLLSAPNRLWPVEFHTTGLGWVPWLPDAAALAYAAWRGRLPRGVSVDDRRAEGFRGVGYWEVARWLAGTGARVVGGPADDLAAWRALAAARPGSASRRRLKLAYTAVLESLVAPGRGPAGWPVAAFLPYLNLTLAKPFGGSSRTDAERLRRSGSGGQA